MKKTMMRAAAVLLFTAVGLILFSGISQVLRRKTGQEVDMMQVLYHIPEQSADVLVLGSSHGYMGIDENLMWTEFGIPSFAMCSSSQSPAVSYYTLKEVLKYQSPKVVLMELYTFYYDTQNLLTEPEHAQLSKGVDPLRLGEFKVEEIGDLFREMSWKERLNWYLPFLKYHSRWKELVAYDFDPMYFLRGSKVTFQTRPAEDPGMTDELGELFDYNMSYFEKIRALCEENGISLVVFTTPIATGSEESFRLKIGANNALEQYMEQQGIPYLYYQKLNETGIDFSADFFDETHLNTRGMEKITRHMGKWLKENYELPDHRGDAAYSRYDTDAALYREYRDRLEQNQSGGGNIADD